MDVIRREGERERESERLVSESEAWAGDQEATRDPVGCVSMRARVLCPSSAAITASAAASLLRAIMICIISVSNVSLSANEGGREGRGDGVAVVCIHQHE